MKALLVLLATLELRSCLSSHFSSAAPSDLMNEAIRISIRNRLLKYSHRAFTMTTNVGDLFNMTVQGQIKNQLQHETYAWKCDIHCNALFPEAAGGTIEFRCTKGVLYIRDDIKAEFRLCMMDSYCTQYVILIHSSRHNSEVSGNGCYFMHRSHRNIFRKWRETPIISCAFDLQMEDRLTQNDCFQVS